jgi:aspartate aminotransferase-like enzyme
MIKQYLLSPGPTPIPNEVALAMSETMIHHRTPQFNKVFEEARQVSRLSLVRTAMF